MTSQYKADLLLVLTTLIAACGWVFSREAVAGMPVFGFLGIRFLAASLCLLPFCSRQRGRIPREQWRPVLISGGWQAVSLALWIYAVAHTPSLGEGAFIMSLSMLFVPLVAWPVLHIVPLRAFWESLPLAAVGLALLTLHGQLSLSPGQLWFLLAALAQAIYFCHTSRCARNAPLLPMTAVQLACTGVLGIVLSIALEPWPHHISGVTLLWLLASIIIATSLRFGLQLLGQKNTSAANAAIIMILEPLLTVVVAAFWYHERLAGQKILGGVLILLALFWYRWRTLPRQRAPITVSRKTH